MSGGNDSLTFYRATAPGTISIDMGDGNDTLIMTNVHDLFPGIQPPPGGLDFTNPGLTSIKLGSGNDIAIMRNVSAATNLEIEAGDGHDMLTLEHVTAGAIKTVFPNSVFTVDVGPGNGDLLSVTHCTGDQTTLQDTGGTNGLLIKSGNNFATEIDTGFQRSSKQTASTAAILFHCSARQQR